ncbi:hypothetical protein A2856_01205 [Candidatus Uhrbacteria bacterium RIFCSPHIGHO2_01_FULL_63_20]|uniref:Endonuclease/exonuclease/phosphatase domain-containing protein n=1 Tax=Candidatus Uhrbacteria bacterium RIFCSPHIGHO2_01_FULL_63_20 TaxID=1802385 RepID=A0A1F7TMT3_9BACT|nr:MAG: hypothetical protein A2856_01205 [Candidatus Uhrbacteria bacterium RIFCSPHIGHO2_01_FULL_63_20]
MHFRDYYGLATFVRPPLSPVTVTETFVHVVNFHGLWNGLGKDDSPDRLEQSRKIVETIKKIDGEIILCGDFNLNPNTESMAIVEAAGLRNLVKEYGITSTRTSLYAKPGRITSWFPRG